MKKIFSTLAIAAMALTAAAQVPTGFNYQGATTEKSADITVSFDVKDAALNTIYTEVQEVRTNAEGYFTTVIGAGLGEVKAGDWAEIDWTLPELSIITTIKGQEEKATACKLMAVPYANLAAGYVGQKYIEDDLQELIEAQRNVVKVADLEAVKADVADLDHGLVELNDELNAVCQAIREDYLSKEDFANIEENLEMLVPQIEALHENVAANTDAIAILSDDLQGLVEAQRNVVKVDDLTPLQEGLSVVEDDLRDLVAANRENTTDIAMMKEAFAHMEENNDMAVELINTMIEKIDANEEAIANTSSDVQGIQEAMRGKANVEDVVALQEAMDYVSSDVQGLQEAMRGKASVEEVAAMTDAIEYVTSDVQGIMETLRNKADIADYESMKAALDELRRQIANNAAAIAGLTAVINR